MERRAKERRSRARRKHRRDRMLVKQESALVAKALGKSTDDVGKGSGSDASSLSSDYERKGVTVPSKHLKLDYGLPPEHPVNRGAAPDASARATIKHVNRQLWADFGIARVRKTGGLIGRLRAYVPVPSASALCVARLQVLML
jgi:hypothetical protein